MVNFGCNLTGNVVRADWWLARFPHVLESPLKYLNFFILNSRPWKCLKIGQVL